jgi:WD40 repeat protein
MRLLCVSKTTMVEALAFSADGSRLAVGGDRADVRVWELTRSHKPLTLPETRRTGGLAFAPDGALSVAHINGIDVWPSLAHKSRFAVHSGTGWWRFARSADGSHLFCLEAAGVRRLSCYRMPRPWLLWTAEWPHEPYGLYSFPLWDPVGGRPVVAGPHGICFLDPATGRYASGFDLKDLGFNHVDAATFRPDGSVLACLVDGVRLYDPTGKLLTRLTDSTPIPSCLAFSADGRLLACGLRRGEVRFWSTDGWSELPTFDPGIGAIHSLAFSPDGCLIAAGGMQGRVALWDLG